MNWQGTYNKSSLYSNYEQVDLKERLEKAEGEKSDILKEKNEAQEDLKRVESAFSDVFRKYERSKILIESLKNNEETLIERDQELNLKLKNREDKYNALNGEVNTTLEKMHKDYEDKMKEMDNEINKLRALLKIAEMKTDKFQNDLEMKDRENSKLQSICDDLINGKS